MSAPKWYRDEEAGVSRAFESYESFFKGSAEARSAGS
jgi:hypothetical protein